MLLYIFNPLLKSMN